MYRTLNFGTCLPYILIIASMINILWHLFIWHKICFSAYCCTINLACGMEQPCKYRNRAYAMNWYSKCCLILRPQYLARGMEQPFKYRNRAAAMNWYSKYCLMLRPVMYKNQYIIGPQYQTTIQILIHGVRPILIFEWLFHTAAYHILSRNINDSLLRCIMHTWVRILYNAHLSENIV